MHDEFARDRILEIHQQREQFDKELKDLTDQLRKSCSHDTIVQGPSNSSNRSLQKICVICGIEETSWESSGFRVLKKRPYKTISDDQLIKYRKLLPVIAVTLLLPAEDAQ